MNKDILEHIKQNKGLSSVELGKHFNIKHGVMRTIIGELRDEGHPIQTINNGYYYQDEGYLDNIKQQILGQIKTLKQSYEQKARAYYGRKNMQFTLDVIEETIRENE